MPDTPIPIPIRFRPNIDKAVEAITLVAREAQGIDFFHIAKVLYYADKEHLQRYGRPILGDAYIRMTWGPVPSLVYDLLKRSPGLPADWLQVIGKAVEVKDVAGIPVVMPARIVCEGVLSDSDRRCLEQATKRYAHMAFAELSALTHRERAWLAASPNEMMDYALIIDDDVPGREKLIEELREISGVLVF